MSSNEILRKEWIKSGAYKTESLSAYIERVLEVF